MVVKCVTGANEVEQGVRVDIGHGWQGSSHWKEGMVPGLEFADPDETDTWEVNGRGSFLFYLNFMTISSTQKYIQQIL